MAAEDVWENLIHEASWGGVKLDLQGTVDSVTRAVAIYRYPRRDGAETEDMGAEPRTTRVRAIFRCVGTDPEAHNRLLRFLDLVNDGEPHTFVHPIFGSYEARIASEVTVACDAETRSTYMAEWTFMEHSTEVAAFAPGPGTALSSGLEEVTASADHLDQHLASKGLSSKAGSLAKDLVNKWQKVTTTLREVNLDLVRTSNFIQTEMDRLELATDVSRYPIFVSMTTLLANLREAGFVATEAQKQLISFTVVTDTPLFAIVARLYGAAEASTRYDQVRQLNDIRSPLLIPAGTTLRAQSPTAPRARLRSPT